MNAKYKQLPTKEDSEEIISNVDKIHKAIRRCGDDLLKRYIEDRIIEKNLLLNEFNEHKIKEEENRKELIDKYIKLQERHLKISERYVELMDKYIKTKEQLQQQLQKEKK